MKTYHFLLLFLCLNFSGLLAQKHPSDMPPGSIIFEGEVINKEAMRSTENISIPGLYTINWFSVDVVYDGDIETNEMIPVITLGGGNESEFVIAHHAPEFEQHYKYITSLTRCFDCIEGMIVYTPNNFVGAFNEEVFSSERSKLKARIRIGEFQREKECNADEVSILYLSFSNISIEIDGPVMHGSVEIQTKTNDSEKLLVNLSSKIVL